MIKDWIITLGLIKTLHLLDQVVIPWTKTLSIIISDTILLHMPFHLTIHKWDIMSSLDVEIQMEFLLLWQHAGKIERPPLFKI